MIRTPLIVCALALGVSACTTFAPFGRVEYRRTDSRGLPRSEYIYGLFAVPTPSGNTVVLLPLYKSYVYNTSPASVPPSVQSWLTESASPVPAPPAPGPE